MRETNPDPGRVDSPALRWAEWIYLRLMRAYPAEFRREYGLPVLQLFRDQCRDAHRLSGMWGLIKTCFGAGWDLGKSAAAEHISNLKGEFPMLNPSRPRNPRRRWLAAVFVTVCAASLAVTWMLPKFYASTARIAVVKPAADSEAASASRAGQTSYDPYFVQTELERLGSGRVLAGVITRLDLVKRWARKYEIPGLSEGQAMAILKKRLDLRLRPGSSLIDIRVLNEDPREAAEIANLLVDAYRDMRLESLRVAAQDGMRTLQDKLAEQEERVRAAAEHVTDIRNRSRHRGLRRRRGDRRSPGTRSACADSALKRRNPPWPSARLAPCWTAWRGWSPTSGWLCCPPCCPTRCSPIYSPGRDQLAIEADGIKQDFGAQHPNRVKAEALLASADRRIAERVEGILAGLQFKLQTLEEERKRSLESYEEGSRALG